MNWTKEEIEAGLALLKAWYEGWKLEDITPEMLFDAIGKAVVA